MKYVSTAISDSLSVNGIFTVFKPDLSQPKIALGGESHDFPEIIYVENGRHTVIVDGVEYRLFGGQALMYAPGAHHIAKEPSTASAYIISFESDSPLITKLSNRIITLNSTQKNVFLSIIEDGKKCFESRSSLEQNIGGMILKQDANEFVLQRIKKQLEFFLIDIYNSENASQESSKTKKDLNEVTEFLSENIEKRLTLADVANGCSMSVSKLKMLFRKNHGTGVIDYFINLKINRAKHTACREAALRSLLAPNPPITYQRPRESRGVGEMVSSSF